MDVRTLLEPTINLERLVAILDGLGHDGRFHTVRTWGFHDMERIFEAVKGHRAVDLDYFVPTSEKLVEVQHDLHNTVPLPMKAQKRFFRAAEDEKLLGGCNPQTFSRFTGPGYYVAYKGEGEHEGELVVDYQKLPKDKPTAWPEIRGNDGLLGGIVYGGMTDYVRGISTHVSIGAAFKGGKPRNQYFALVRRDAS